MTIILASILTLLAFHLGKRIRKHFITLMILSIILSGLSIFIEFQLFQIITEGFIGLALFVVVMYAGALKKESKLSKKLRSVRKEYSILGFILLIPHFYIYLEKYLSGVMDWEWYGIAAMIIMVPLFITSFKLIKSKMKMKTWKQLQKWAYLAYAATFIHLILMAEPQESIVYFVIFGVYSILKVRNYLLINSPYKNIASVTVLLITVLLALFNVSDILDVTSNNSVEGTMYNDTNLEDGTYTGSGSGFQSLDVEVEVVVENNEIVEINVIDCGCTSAHRGIDFEDAVDEIASDVIQKQSTDIDSISGATKSTEGLLEAVEDALNQEQ